MLRTCLCGLLWGAGAGVAIAPYIESERAEASREAALAQATHHASIRVKTSRVELVGEQVVGGGVIYDTTKFTISGAPGEQSPRLVQHVRSADFYNIEPFSTADIDIHSVLWDRLTTSHAIVDQGETRAADASQSGSVYVGKATYDSLKYGSAGAPIVFANRADDRIIKDRVEVEFSIALQPGS